MLEYRVVVFGSRHAKDPWPVRQELSRRKMQWPPGLVIVNGCAPGIDSFARQWAVDLGIPVDDYPIRVADWDRYKKGAGPRRNQQMIDEGKPNEGIAFPGGSGTLDMLDRMEHAGIPVIKMGSPQEWSLLAPKSPRRR